MMLVITRTYTVIIEAYLANVKREVFPMQRHEPRSSSTEFMEEEPRFLRGYTDVLIGVLPCVCV